MNSESKYLQIKYMDEKSKKALEIFKMPVEKLTDNKNSNKDK